MVRSRILLSCCFITGLALLLAGCSRKTNNVRTLSLTCMEDKAVKIRAILDTAKVGTEDFKYPQQSVDDLEQALTAVQTGISYAKAGRFILQYEADNVCTKADQAIAQFLGSYNFTLPAGSNGELLVNGLNRKGSVDFGDNAAYSNSNTFTVELWVKYNKDFLDFEMATLIGTTSEGPQSNWPDNKFEGWNIHYQRSGNLRASMGVGSGVLEQAKAYPTNYGKWNHVALVWDINAQAGPGEDRPYHMKMYVNGELFWQKNNDILAGGVPRAMLPSTGKKMRAFIDPYHLDRCMTGYIKKFRMWKEAKTPAQLQQLMNSDVTGTEPALICAWDFTVVPADPENVKDKTGKYTAKIQGSYKWMPVQP